jgi:phosphoglycolate phosphatase-like HAD superfamily hydrolase
MTSALTLWHETPTRQAIQAFINAATTPDSPDFIPPAERIAVFDNDGTLWCEKPLYIQLDLILRKLTAQAEDKPALRARQPWQAAWEKDYNWLGSAVTKHYKGDDAQLQVLLEGILALSKDQPVEQVEVEAQEFIDSVHHPSLGLSYRDCIYLPMLELLRYLETNGFTSYIVSAGGRDFVRGFSQGLYGIPRERVIGSTVVYRYAESDDGGKIIQQARLNVIADGPVKPVQIWNLIGRQPVLAAGNSNGDLEMLAFTGGKARPALRLLLVHDDAEREFAYTAGAEKILNTAQAHGWTTVSMQRDFVRVFPSPGLQPEGERKMIA